MGKPRGRAKALYFAAPLGYNNLEIYCGGSRAMKDKLISLGYEYASKVYENHGIDVGGSDEGLRGDPGFDALLAGRRRDGL